MFTLPSSAGLFCTLPAAFVHLNNGKKNEEKAPLPHIHHSYQLSSAEPFLISFAASSASLMLQTDGVTTFSMTLPQVQSRVVSVVKENGFGLEDLNKVKSKQL